MHRLRRWHHGDAFLNKVVKAFVRCVSRTVNECVGYHTIISNLVCGILYHTLFQLNFGECVGHSKFECVGQLSRKSQSGKGYVEEMLLQPRSENICAMMAIRQGSSSASLALSGSVNCVSASSLRPPLLSAPSVWCGVGTALPNGDVCWTPTLISKSRL